MSNSSRSHGREQALQTVYAYHRRSKHRLQRYAAGPGGLDWANQPDPFRCFAGCAQQPLPLLHALAGPSYADVSVGAHGAARAPGIDSIGALLQLSFGLSAWKQYGGSRWALRCNPSSGNLHPTEAYLVTGGGAGLTAGIHHYVSRDHLLEQRCAFADAPAIPADSLLLGLSAIHWREAWKYGERAYRYCQHDAGHAIAAVSYAAATLGWQARLLDEWSDDEIAALLGLDRAADFSDAEQEHPDLLLLLRTGAGAPAGLEPAPLLEAAGRGRWQGQANRLSADHGHQWPVIDEVASACHKPHIAPSAWPAPELPAPLPSACSTSAADLIRQRRSAQAFDGTTSISSDSFYRMLDMTLPRTDLPPWSVIQWPAHVQLLLFVHRVDGLAPGLYLLLRNDTAEAVLRERCRRELDWAPVPGCPAHLRLFRLLAGDAREAAQILSCHQEIAADSAFSLAMLAEYDAALAEGAWRYRQLFWEAGMLGQVLYLEAEAAGVRGTGIGCFFDDSVHDLLGLEDDALQSLYHFTVGGAVTDTRLQTLPPYAHLQRD